MAWLTLSLLAPAIYALVVLLDKYIVSKEVKDYRCIPLYSALVAFLIATCIWISIGFPLLDIKNSLIVLFSGLLTIISFVIYYKAMVKAQVSTVNILFQMGPIFILVFAFLFLGERINLKQILGFSIIFATVFFASIEKKRNKIQVSQAFFLILLYDILWAASAVYMKSILGSTSFTKSISYFGWGVGVGGVFLYMVSKSTRKAFHKSLARKKSKSILLIVLNEAIFLFGRFVTYLAYSLGPVSIVSILEGTQVFYGILFSWILMQFAQSIFREGLTVKYYTRKLFLALILMIGIWLMY